MMVSLGIVICLLWIALISTNLALLGFGWLVAIQVIGLVVAAGTLLVNWRRRRSGP